MALPGFLRSKIQAPDVLRVMWIWSFIGVVSFAQIFWDVYRPVRGGVDSKGYIFGRDFVNVWMGGRLALQGQLSHLFGKADYMTELRAVFGPDYTDHNFSYPPHILALIIVFGLLPYFPAFAVWVCSGAAALWSALRASHARGARWHLPLLVIFSPAFLANLVSGQNGAFTASCLLGGLYLSESAPIQAGVLFGILTVKPHLGILVPFALLLRRNWKCIFSSGITAFVLIVLSLLLWGAAPWRDYVTQTLPYQSKLLDLTTHLFYIRMMPGLFADASAVLQLGPLWSGLLQAAAALWAFVAVLFAVNREGLTARCVALLALGTLIILPYDFNYDMVMVAGSLAVYLAMVEEMPVLTHLVFGLLWALPLAIYAVKTLPYTPISSAVLLLSFLCLQLQGRKKPT